MKTRMYRSFTVCAAFISAALLVTHPAQAAVANSNFNVTATVVASCQIATTDMAFGNYSGVQLDGISTVTATCTNTTPYTIGLSAGTFAGATVTTRRMTGPAAAGLPYSLFREAGRTTNWGVTIGTDTVAGTGNCAAQPITAYGRISAGQFASPGSYSDTITATLTY